MTSVSIQAKLHKHHPEWSNVRLRFYIVYYRFMMHIISTIISIFVNTTQVCNTKPLFDFIFQLIPS